MMGDDEEPCGATHEIEPQTLASWACEEPVRQLDGVTLVCSRPWGHTPPERHSDGVNDWEEYV